MTVDVKSHLTFSGCGWTTEEDKEGWRTTGPHEMMQRQCRCKKVKGTSGQTKNEWRRLVKGYIIIFSLHHSHSTFLRTRSHMRWSLHKLCCVHKPHCLFFGGKPGWFCKYIYSPNHHIQAKEVVHAWTKVHRYFHEWSIKGGDWLVFCISFKYCGQTCQLFSHKAFISHPRLWKVKKTASYLGKPISAEDEAHRRSWETLEMIKTRLKANWIHSAQNKSS